MKVSYSYVRGRTSSHCITFVHRKRRYRRYFKSRIDAVKFQNEKRLEFGIKDPTVMENEAIFHVLSEIKEKLETMDRRMSELGIPSSSRRKSWEVCENLPSHAF